MIERGQHEQRDILVSIVSAASENRQTIIVSRLNLERACGHPVNVGRPGGEVKNGEYREEATNAHFGVFTE